MTSTSRRMAIGIGAAAVLGAAVYGGWDIVFPPAPAPLNLAEGDVIGDRYPDPPARGGE